MSYLELAKRKAKELGLDRKEKEGQVSDSDIREEIDRFFVSEILLRLSVLHRDGKLPDLSSCLLWQEAEQLWNTLAEGSSSPASVEKIKAAMRKAVASYEGEKV